MKNINFDSYAIQTKNNLPQYLYTYTKNDFSIHQINPYKKIKTLHHKNKPNSLCFSFCGEYLFCLYNNKLQLFYKKNFVNEVLGEFTGYKLKRCSDKVVLIGSFNVVLYNLSNDKDDNKQCKEPSLLDTPVTIYDFHKCEGINLPRFYTKVKGDDIFIAGDKWLVSNTNQIIVYVNEIEKRKITVPYVIKQMHAISSLQKIYCLCEDGKIYVSKLEDETHSSVISCDGRIVKFCVSSCETFLYVATEDEFIVYFTKHDNIMDRVEIENQVYLAEAVLSQSAGGTTEYFDVKL